MYGRRVTAMCEESSDSDAYVSADESLGYEAETKEALTAR